MSIRSGNRLIKQFACVDGKTDRSSLSSSDFDAYSVCRRAHVYHRRVFSCRPSSENMAPNLIRPSQMLIFDPATVSLCYMGQRQVAPQGAGRPTSAATTAAPSSTSPPPPPAKRTYVKNISPEEKILRK